MHNARHINRKGQYVVSERTVERLSLYRRVLLQLRAEGKESILSHELAALVHGKAAQVRRDVMQLGYSGVPNSGYNVRRLIESISDFLDTPRMQGAALVGLGHLGLAILSHFSGRWRQLAIRAAFDTDPAKVDRMHHGCRCYAIQELAPVVREQNIDIGVITVPAEHAQAVAEALCAVGISGILNFAPVQLRLPDTVYVDTVDLTMSLEKVAYFARQRLSAREQESTAV